MGHIMQLMYEYEVYIQHYQKSNVTVYIHTGSWSKLGPVEQSSKVQ